MIENVVERLRLVFDRIVLVGRAYRDFECIEDKLCLGPVGGVMIALQHLKNDVFVVGCDMPLLQPHVISSMWEVFQSSDPDAVVARLCDGIHPLHAFYSVRMMDHFLWSIEQADGSFRSALERAKVVWLSEQHFSHLPNWYESFFNVNVPDDLDRIEVRECC